MILDLATCNITQAQALEMLSNMGQIEEAIAKGICSPSSLELTTPERDLLILQLRSTAIQFQHLAKQIAKL